jgi:hypothetical protein
MAMIDAATPTDCATVAPGIHVRQRSPGQRWHDGGMRNAIAPDGAALVGAITEWGSAPPFTAGVRGMGGSRSG